MKLIENLVIGYGNTLRSDDGVGVRVAEIVADWNLPEVRSLALPQLTPELAAQLAEVNLAIFVDVCQTIEDVKLLSLKPSESIAFKSHFSEPRALLSLTQALFKKCPQAWWVIVPGENFQLGDHLSPLAEHGVDRALSQIQSLLLQPEMSQDLCTKSV